MLLASNSLLVEGWSHYLTKIRHSTFLSENEMASEPAHHQREQQHYDSNYQLIFSLIKIFRYTGNPRRGRLWQGDARGKAQGNEGSVCTEIYR